MKLHNTILFDRDASQGTIKLLNKKVLSNLCFACAMILYLGSIMIFFLLPHEEFYYILFICIHTLSIFCVCSAMALTSLFSFSFMLSVFGISVLVPLAGSIVAALFYWYKSKNNNHTALSDYREYISATPLYSNAHRTDDEETDTAQVTTYAEIITGPASLDEKIRTLKILEKQENPDAIELIRYCLHDIHDEIRLIAAGILNTIEKRIMNAIVIKKDEIEKNHTSAESFTQLGYLYFNYCYLGILDETNYKYCMGKAQEAYKKALELDAYQHHSMLQIGKTYIFQNNYIEALHYLNHYIEKRPNDSNGYIWKAEVYFRSKQYKTLTAFMSLVSANSAIEQWHRFKSIQNVWLIRQNRTKDHSVSDSCTKNTHHSKTESNPEKPDEQSFST